METLPLCDSFSLKILKYLSLPFFIFVFTSEVQESKAVIFRKRVFKLKSGVGTMKSTPLSQEIGQWMTARMRRQLKLRSMCSSTFSNNTKKCSNPLTLSCKGSKCRCESIFYFNYMVCTLWFTLFFQIPLAGMDSVVSVS